MWLEIPMLWKCTPCSKEIRWIRAQDEGASSWKDVFCVTIITLVVSLWSQMSFKIRRVSMYFVAQRDLGAFTIIPRSILRFLNIFWISYSFHTLSCCLCFMFLQCCARCLNIETHFSEAIVLFLACLLACLCFVWPGVSVTCGWWSDPFGRKSN